MCKLCVQPKKKMKLSPPGSRTCRVNRKCSNSHRTDGPFVVSMSWTCTQVKIEPMVQSLLCELDFEEIAQQRSILCGDRGIGQVRKRKLKQPQQGPTSAALNVRSRNFSRSRFHFKIFLRQKSRLFFKILATKS